MVEPGVGRSLLDRLHFLEFLVETANDVIVVTEGTLEDGARAGVFEEQETGTRFEWEGFSFEVVGMDGRRIDKVLVEQGQGGEDDR